MLLFFSYNNCIGVICRKGFTLIEVLVVVLIIAVLAAVAVPQYQKAVLKSRFSSLMPTTKAVHNGNEAYYLMHSGYARLLNELDVTATNNNDMTLELSRDPDYSYVLATRPGINNNLIMYQKHSTQFPGEIHCEAKDQDTQANWLCEKGMHAVKGLGEVITQGFNTYVLEGTGNGLTHAQLDAAQKCEAAEALGATCTVTTEPNTNNTIRQVCYNINGTGDYCITTEFNVDDKQTKRTVCSSSMCVEYEYNDKGAITKVGECSADRQSEDKKSCNTYELLTEYEYDSVTGKMSKEYHCEDYVSASEKKCDKYEVVTEYNYPNGVQESKKCYGSNVAGNSCDRYNDIYTVTVDPSTENTISKQCRKQEMNAEQTACDKYYKMTITSSDGNGTQISKTCDENYIVGNSCTKYDVISIITSDGKGNEIHKSCAGKTVSGDSCPYYDNVYEYSYDEDGHQIKKYCSGHVTGESCGEHGYVYAWQYAFDEAGNKISSKMCSKWNANKTECMAWREQSSYEYYED